MNRTLSDFDQAYWTSGIDLLAGVDEAGRGPLAGPVVAAAVVFEPGTRIDGVDDSKKLTPSRREELYDVICRVAVDVAVGVVDHETIDRLNILNATTLAMRSAIGSLSKVPRLAIIDGNSFTDGEIRFTNIIGGDAKSMTIAAASIVAKVRRDAMMLAFDREFPVYGFGRHKGYGTRNHIEAIRRYGLCPIHRRSFHVSTLDSNR
ncbi:MAG TPA: ribonuclease HII [Bacteroidota bacterium]|nr:ribonuclease HII [Bacteroidota bacterium]